ncbi:MAG: histidine phosphotransferase family protein, partial [Pseudomonadota bacterium]
MSDAQNIVHISSLLASRLCHDLVNPVGALSTGLDVLGEGDDPEMQAHAMALIKESTHKTIAILTLARLAYGSSGGWEGDLDMGEAKPLATDFFVHSKAELVWGLTESAMAKPRARALLCLLIIAERTAPRAGSQVVIAKEGEGYTVTATGPKVKFSDEVRQAVAGDVQNLQAKETPAYLAYLLCQAHGDTLSA